jgi:hypothetical protein
MQKMELSLENTENFTHLISGWASCVPLSSLRFIPNAAAADSLIVGGILLLLMEGTEVTGE